MWSSVTFLTWSKLFLYVAEEDKFSILQYFFICWTNYNKIRKFLYFIQEVYFFQMLPLRCTATILVSACFSEKYNILVSACFSSWLDKVFFFVVPSDNSSTSGCCSWWSCCCRMRINNCRCMGGRCMGIADSFSLSPMDFDKNWSSDELSDSPKERKKKKDTILSDPVMTL